MSLKKDPGAPDHDNHHDDDFHDRCLDCRLAIKPDHINADDDLLHVHYICFPELEDDSDDSSTVTDKDGLQPPLSGDGTPDSPGVNIDLDNALKALQHESIDFSDDNKMLKKENQNLKDWQEEMRAQYLTLEARLHRRDKTIHERDEAVKAFRYLNSELRRQTQERLKMLDSYSCGLAEAESQASIQAYHYKRQLKEAEKLFEKRVTQIRDEMQRK